ncbi:ATP-dependent dethiobiotin synthetase BioD [Buchnera aphidicola (Pterocallis alni)]|uniref:dethiobiotin synthase n=1 Tax=Buchnera aphidicola TaxID=9 RepID=UPI003463FBED
MIKKWFITGTDTNIGKTTVSILLLNKAKKMGFCTAGYKPISSGCIKTNTGYCNNDVLLLKNHSTEKFAYNTINPFSLYHTGPPSILMKQANQLINLTTLSHRLSIIQQKSNWIVIEGIGGFYTPICKYLTLSNWIKKENLPVILVVGIKLGCINHAILTYQLIIKEKLKFSGWFANCLSNNTEYFIEYLDTIKKFIKAPFLGTIPFLGKKYITKNTNIKIKLPY